MIWDELTETNYRRVIIDPDEALAAARRKAGLPIPSTPKSRQVNDHSDDR